MWRAFVIAALAACGSATKASPVQPKSPDRATARIDSALLESALNALLTPQEDAQPIVERLFQHERHAPATETQLVDRLIVALSTRGHGDVDRAQAKRIANGFADLYPNDVCVGAILHVEVLDELSGADQLATCFPRLARAHQYVGERCQRTESSPEARDTDLLACGKAFARCLALDSSNSACSSGLERLRSEWLRRYCTTADMFSTLAVIHPADSRSAFDVADFAYAIETAPDRIELILNARGRERFSRWQPLFKLRPVVNVNVRSEKLERGAFDGKAFELRGIPLERVCDRIQRRDSAFP